MGWRAHFFFGATRGGASGRRQRCTIKCGRAEAETIFQDMTTNLAELLERTIPPLGYELVDWEGTPGGRLVRVFIDKPNGSVTKLSVDDCARVSNHLTRLFAVEN